jgi:outer membrane protein assembly factor BamB
VALDLATQKVVWNYPRGGSLAISSNGVLYILTNVGHLSAINLK